MKAPRKQYAHILSAAGLMILFAALVIGCGAPAAPPPPVTVRETVIVPQEQTRIVEATVQVEATTVVERVVTATPEPPNLSSGGTLTIASTAASQVEPFSPLFCNSGYCFIPMNTLLLGLTTHDDKGQPVPAIAESWEANETSDVWTFHLNPDAVWSDGEPITAEDVVWTYTTGLHPETGGNMTKQANLLQIKGAKEFNAGEADTIEGIKAIDDKTVEFTLEGPSATFVNEVWHGIVPSHMLEGVSYAEMKTNPFNVDGPTVVSGPLKLVRRDGDSIFELAKNENYWGKPVQFDQVIVKALNDDVAAAQAEAGEIEYGRIPASEFARLGDQEHLDTVLSNVDLFYDWVVNTRKPYLQDARVRQALAYALDRQAILDYAWEGNGEIVIPPFAPEWAKNPNLNTYAQDVEKAKALLEEAGWDPNQKIVIMVGPWPDNVKPAEITHAQ
jgi:peptide/nickel transport system substrate-binding protein